MNKDSILEMARGAIKERADYEMGKIIDNIMDVNTTATKKRTLTITVDVTPDDTRQQLVVKVIAKSKLEPTNPVTTTLSIASDGNGEMAIYEWTPQLPGQRNFDGMEQEEPKILKIAR